MKMNLVIVYNTHISYVLKLWADIYQNKKNVKFWKIL